MKLRHFTYFLFLLFVGTASSQKGIKSIKVEIEYYAEEENPVEFFKAAEDIYQLTLLSGQFKNLAINFRVRIEDELTSEETYVVLSDVSFFDFQLGHRLGPLAVTWSVENLLGWNNREFAIEGYLEGEGVTSSAQFAHEADFMVSTAISYRF